MSKWFQNGYIIKDIMSIENKRAYEEKPDGNIMFSHGWVYVTTPEAQDTYSKGLGFKVYYYPLHNDWFIGNVRSNVNISIPQQAKNPVKAIQFLQLLNTQENGDLASILSWGLQDKQWTLVSEGVPGKTRAKIKTLEYDSSQGLSSYSYATYPWALSDNLLAAVNQSFDPTAEAVMKALLAKSRVSPISGFNPKSTDFTTEFAQVQAVITEYQYQLEFGTLADNTAVYNEFLGKLKAAGNDKIIASLQAQLDAFMKTKK
jgi:putative aldouronate transport system substrate-binding protein